MLELSYRTRGNAHPQGKPRVYFTCHPTDYDRSFEQITQDILQLQDCAVYFTTDMTEHISEEDRWIQLRGMNLFVVPVSRKLMIDPNRAMDEDIAFAFNEHIPVLPIMLDPGLDHIYSLSDRFGDRHYLILGSTDNTGLSYKEKLQRYLQSVLLDDETARRVRAAFDCMVFLSYRKKDRKYADELMRLIHRDPACWDIAIWYDEFLTPGEGFNEAIAQALKKSNLFALLVTPNLINEENYIRTTEYPAARKAGKTVLPVEMVATNPEELARLYEGIPPRVLTEDEESFHATLLDALRDVALRENDSDPAHQYLIGLAYLEGVDVEIDRERALKLITSAAEAGLPEAMQTLYEMHRDGKSVTLDYQKALYWAEKSAEFHQAEKGEEHPDTLKALNDLASACLDAGDTWRANNLQEKVYALRCKVLGEKHPDTIASLNSLVLICSERLDHSRAKELAEKVYALNCEVYGEEHPITIISMYNLAAIYGDLGEHKRALSMLKEVYKHERIVFGVDHPRTLQTLSGIAVTYNKLGDYSRAKEIGEKVYALGCKVLGKEHPETLTMLHNLASVYGNLGDHERELDIKEMVYVKRYRLFGEDHKKTLETLYDLRMSYTDGDQDRVFRLTEQLYTLRSEALGKDHPKTLSILYMLGMECGKRGEHGKALEYQKQLFELRRQLFGEEHIDTIKALNNIAVTYRALGNLEKSKELLTKVSTLISKVLGETHPDTLKVLNNLALTYKDLKDLKTAQDLLEKVYNGLCVSCGERHPDTLMTLHNLAVTCQNTGDYLSARELLEKVYRLRCEVLGEKHPDTLATQNILTMNRELSGE